ncbi:RNA-metabolizing metallo-beta-lactamase [Ancylostoma caninum]|uniref:Cleavage and polyadenylation specificity factor subunit 2 n=1 Tax=Ancylostoma caninum TaxID=29170 RepID=A0A368FX09_ANCCA|nr:RNA-metabolizing metallo-beta-lactamase [Ancylostoma caninum]
MSSVVKLEALSGVKDEGPLCYLLQIEETFLLLDCGWDEKFDMAYIESIKSRIPQVDSFCTIFVIFSFVFYWNSDISAVLITHPDQPHLGALAYLVKYCDLTAPVYCTVPVYKMGMMFMYDWINSLISVENFELFTLDDVDVAFDRMQKLKFNQTVPLRGDSQIKITALPAGHMIGGAMWRITRHDEEDIIYAVDYNHKKERHLNGCSFDTILRPYLLITDSLNAMYTQPRRKERDEQLVTTILKTVRQNGDCVIVIDTAGRVLEIAHLLDQLWANTQSGLQKYNLVMMSHVAASVVEFAKSQVEWMSDKVLKSFETGHTNPFLLKNVKLCHSQIDLARVRSPKVRLFYAIIFCFVVLCSGIDMECGYSRELFLDWCSDSRNSFIITGRSSERTLCSKLIYMAECFATNTRTNRIVALEVKKRVRLEGAELEAYKKKKAQKDKEESRRRLEEQEKRQAELRGYDSDDDDEMIASALAAVETLRTKKTREEEQTGTGKSGEQLAKKPTPMIIDVEPKEEVTDEADANGEMESCAIPGLTMATVKVREEGLNEAPAFIPTGPTFPTRKRRPVRHNITMQAMMRYRMPFFKRFMPIMLPMYPLLEEKVKWDVYGEKYRPEDYTVSKLRVHLPVPQEIIKEADDPTANMAVPVIDDAPTKCITVIEKIEVSCNVEYIEFEGRSDGESVKKLIAQMKPKQLILVHGSAQATRHLAQHCYDNNIAQGHIFTPSVGDIVDATVASHIYRILLNDELFESLEFIKVKDADLAWIDAQITARPSEVGVERDDGMEVDQPADAHLSDQHIDKCMLSALSGEAPFRDVVYVNDPKLSEMKQLLLNMGFSAEFSSGVLYIGGVISIRRNEAGRFHIEGCVGPLYLRLRDIILEQFMVL